MIIRSSDQVPRVTALKRFPVPRNFGVSPESRIMRQRTWPAPASTRVKALEVCRYDPDSQGNPHFGTSPELSAPSRFGPPVRITLPHASAIGIAPGLTPNWLYRRIVWGGLWGFLFMLPMVRGHWWLRGIILSLAPTAFQLLYVFPRQAGQGLFGLGLGALTPVFMLAANAIWGLSAAWLLRTTGRA